MLKAPILDFSVRIRYRANDSVRPRLPQLSVFKRGLLPVGPAGQLRAEGLPSSPTVDKIHFRFVGTVRWERASLVPSIPEVLKFVGGEYRGIWRFELCKLRLDPTNLSEVQGTHFGRDGT